MKLLKNMKKKREEEEKKLIFYNFNNFIPFMVTISFISKDSKIR